MDNLVDSHTEFAALSSTTHAVRRVERVRHEIHRRELRVARVESPCADFVRIVFTGDTLDTFTSLGFDDHVKIFFPNPADPAGEPVARDYTPRHCNAAQRELTIDFALHGDGAAAMWAQDAKACQTLVIAGPRGSMIVPMDYDWNVFIGDETAAPAIGRRLAELPAGARAIVLIQLADTAILELARSKADIALQRFDNVNDLLAAATALPLPAGEGYVWAAGEAAAMAHLRTVMLEAKQHPREAMRIAAYWKRGAQAFHEELARAAT